MKPKGSLSYSQVPATCPYPEPAWSSPYLHFLKIHLNIILPSKTGSLSLGFPHQYPVYSSPVPLACYMPHRSYYSWFYTRTILDERYRSLSSSLCRFLHSLVNSSLLGPNILLNTLFSNTLSLPSSRNVSDQVSHPYKTTGKIIVLYILSFKFLDSNLEDKRFCTEWQHDSTILTYHDY